MSRALSTAEVGRIVEIVSEGRGASELRVVRLANSMPVVLRDLRSRDFEEIPLSEWAAHLEREAGGAAFVPSESREELIRRLMAGVGWSLTQKRRPTLEAAYDLAVQRAQA